MAVGVVPPPPDGGGGVGGGGVGGGGGAGGGAEVDKAPSAPFDVSPLEGASCVSVLSEVCAMLEFELLVVVCAKTGAIGERLVAIINRTDATLNESLGHLENMFMTPSQR